LAVGFSIPKTRSENQLMGRRKISCSAEPKNSPGGRWEKWNTLLWRPKDQQWKKPKKKGF